MANVKKEHRQQRALELAEIRARRTPEQQLSALDARLGKGKGAKRERVRLMDLIAANKAKANVEQNKARAKADVEEQHGKKLSKAQRQAGE